MSNRIYKNRKYWLEIYEVVFDKCVKGRKVTYERCIDIIDGVNIHQALKLLDLLEGK